MKDYKIMCSINGTMENVTVSADSAEKKLRADNSGADVIVIMISTQS